MKKLKVLSIVLIVGGILNGCMQNFEQGFEDGADKAQEENVTVEEKQ